MILYKYVSFDAAIKIIESNSIGFSCLEDLNDPFECTAFGFRESNESVVTANVANGACKNNFSRKYVVLCLTRQPLNALMWSHYGDSHQGVVIGIDVDDAGFCDEKDNFIPSQFGEIIYTATKPYKDVPPISPEVLREIGNHVGFDPNYHSFAKKAFLYKSLEWGYEEEVRVVKNITNILLGYHTSEGRYKSWNIIRVSGRPLYCLDIPRSSIKEIFLGRHIYKNFSRKGILSESELDETLNKWAGLDIKMMHCNLDVHSWNLTATLSKRQS